MHLRPIPQGDRCRLRAAVRAKGTRHRLTGTLCMVPVSQALLTAERRRASARRVPAGVCKVAREDTNKPGDRRSAPVCCVDQPVSNQEKEPRAYARGSRPLSYSGSSLPRNGTSCAPPRLSWRRISYQKPDTQVKRPQGAPIYAGRARTMDWYGSTPASRAGRGSTEVNPSVNLRQNTVAGLRGELVQRGPSGLRQLFAATASQCALAQLHATSPRSQGPARLGWWGRARTA